MSVINDFLPVPAAAVPQSADDRVSGSRSGGKAELERRRGWRCGTAGGRNLGGVQGSHRGLEPVTRPSTEPFGPSTNYSSYSLNAWRHLVVGAVYMCVRCDNISLGRTDGNEEPENVKLTSTGAGWDGFGIARRRVTLTLTPHFSCPAPPPTKQRGNRVRALAAFSPSLQSQTACHMCRSLGQRAATIRIIMSQ